MLTVGCNDGPPVLGCGPPTVTCNPDCLWHRPPSCPTASNEAVLFALNMEARQAPQASGTGQAICNLVLLSGNSKRALACTKAVSTQALMSQSPMPIKTEVLSYHPYKRCL